MLNVFHDFIYLDKDVIRTDRTHEYFEGERNPHLEILHDILMTYNMFNFDLGLLILICNEKKNECVFICVNRLCSGNE